MTEDDARARRDHARRGGSATEYDALHGRGLYGRKPSAVLRALLDRLLLPSKSNHPEATKRGTPHPW
jgi:hypothetical protein